MLAKILLEILPASKNLLALLKNSYLQMLFRIVFLAAECLHLPAVSRTPLLSLLQSYYMTETSKHLLLDGLHAALVFLPQASKGTDTTYPDRMKHLKDALHELLYLESDHLILLLQRCIHPKFSTIPDQLLLLAACPSSTKY